MTQQNQLDKTDIAIIGAGMAGLSAAVYLNQLGYSVRIFEAAQQIGGRTRGVALAHATVDNGQHLLLGAYHQTLELLERCQIAEQSCLLRTPLQWQVGALHIKASAKLASPMNLFVAMLNAKGLSWPEKFSLVRLMVGLKQSKNQKRQQDISVASWLSEQGQSQFLIEHLWQPLCIAALNTPLQQASAHYFRQVLRDGLLAGNGASDMLFAKHDLSTALVQPISQYLTAQGVDISLLHRLSAINKSEQGFSLQFNGKQPVLANQVILALAPANLAPFSAWIPSAAQWTHKVGYQPITTLYLQYSEQCRLSAPMIGFPHNLNNDEIALQWLFDRGQIAQQAGLIAAVISAHGQHDDLDNRQLSQQLCQLIHQHYPHFGKPIWTKLIREKRATHSCNVGLQAPSMLTETEGLYLAGDYLHPDYPASIESAVQSGKQCALWIEAHRISR